MVRVGGGFEKLKTYVDKNNRHFKRVIMTYMIKEQMSYDDVVNAMYQGKKKFKDISESQLMDDFQGKHAAKSGYKSAMKSGF
jgi:hypothetical protein